jgi:hypothetical protein
MPPLQTLPDAAVAFYEVGQRYSAAGLIEIRRLWRAMGLSDIDRSWSQVGPEVVATIGALQVGAARESAEYVPTVLAEQGADAPATATVRPSGFARGSSGLTLEDVAATVPAMVKRTIGRGQEPVALRRGLSLLEGIAETSVADAFRLATAAEMVARPDVVTWTRVLNPPSCGRCAVLAGKVFRWNQGFPRHPNCDCKHLPSVVAAPEGERLVDPRAYFDSLSPAEQDARFGKGVAQRIRDGDDLNAAVNSTRDRWRTRLRDERIEKRRTDDGAAEADQPPETFMERLIASATSRDGAVKALADNGYLAA